MPEYFGQCKNNYFNSQIVYTLTGHRTRLPGKVYPAQIQVGNGGLNTEHYTDLYRIAFIRNDITIKLYLDILFVRDNAMIAIIRTNNISYSNH